MFWNKKSKVRKAWEIREGIDAERTPEVSLHSQARWENTKKHLKNMPKIGEIIEIDVSPDSEGNAGVTLIGVDGKRVTIWTNGNVKGGNQYQWRVSSLSDY